MLKKFSLNGGLVVAFSIGGGILGYLFQTVVGSALGPESFGIFASVVAFSVICSAPLNSIFMVVVREFIHRCSVVGLMFAFEFYVAFFRKTTISVFLLIGVAFLFSEFFLYLFPGASGMFLACVAFSFVMGCMILAIIPLFQALNFPILYAFFGFLVSAIKLVVFSGLSWTNVTLELAGLGLVGVNLICLCTLGFCVWFHVKKFKTDSTFAARDAAVDCSDLDIEKFDKHTVFNKENLLLALAHFGFTALAQSDVIIFNFFYPETAGFFALVSILGKAVLYLPSGFVIVAFPMFVNEFFDNAHRSGVVFLGLGLSLCCSVFGVIFLYLAADKLGFFIFGVMDDSYKSAVTVYGLVMIPLGLIFFLEHFALARGRVVFAPLLLVASPLLVIAGWICEGNYFIFLLFSGALSTVVLILGLIKLRADLGLGHG